MDCVRRRAKKTPCGCYPQGVIAGLSWSVARSIAHAPRSPDPGVADMHTGAHNAAAAVWCMIVMGAPIDTAVVVTAMVVTVMIVPMMVDMADIIGLRGQAG
jgi:hypothetical protein